MEGTSTILVVEDDPLLLRALQRDLKSADYTVKAAATAKDALAILAESNDIDGIVTDVTLPDGTCMPVVQQALQRVNAPFVVIITGTAKLEVVFQLAQMGAVALLEKPFTTSQLQEALRKGDVERDGPQTLQAKKLVGRRALQDVLDHVRTEMTNEALAFAGGNRAHAARLLGLTRQAVQQSMNPGDIKARAAKKKKARSKRKKKSAKKRAVGQRHRPQPPSST